MSQVCQRNNPRIKMTFKGNLFSALSHSFQNVLFVCFLVSDLLFCMKCYNCLYFNFLLLFENFKYCVLKFFIMLYNLCLVFYTQQNLYTHFSSYIHGVVVFSLGHMTISPRVLGPSYFSRNSFFCCVPY